MPVTEDELEALYTERYDAFVRVLTGMLRDRERARDAVQDAFARALARRRSYRGDGPLERWVWRIAVRSAFEAVKRDRRRRDSDTSLVPSADGSGAPMHQAVVSAVRALPERERLVVFLRYFADLSYADIAVICGISDGTVGATLAHARATLADALEQEGVSTP